MEIYGRRGERLLRIVNASAREYVHKLIITPEEEEMKLANMQQVEQYKSTPGGRFYKQVTRFFREGAKFLPQHMNPDLINLILNCNKMTRINMYISRDSGQKIVVPAYRVQHLCHAPPSKGGIRLSECVDGEQMEALASLGSVQNGLSGIPFGGGMGGIKIDPEVFSGDEISRILGRYTIELARKKLIGPNMDIIGTEMGMRENYIEIIQEAYAAIAGETEFNPGASCINKKPSMGGIVRMPGAVGKGVVYGLLLLLHNKHFCEKYNLLHGLKDKTVLLQGFGNIGAQTARSLYLQGAKIIGVSDRRGSIINTNGFDIEDLHNYYLEHATLLGYEDITDFSTSNGVQLLFHTPSDIFIAAATELLIDQWNVLKIETKLVVEVANGPCTLAAHEIFEKKNIPVIPDILINGGLGIATYVEHLYNVQDHGNRKGFIDALERDNRLKKFIGKAKTKSDAINLSIEGIMEDVIDEVLNFSFDRNTILRNAAYAIGIRNIYNKTAQNIPINV